MSNFLDWNFEEVTRSGALEAQNSPFPGVTACMRTSRKLPGVGTTRNLLAKRVASFRAVLSAWQKTLPDHSV